MLPAQFVNGENMTLLNLAAGLMILAQFVNGENMMVANFSYRSDDTGTIYKR